MRASLFAVVVFTPFVWGQDLPKVEGTKGYVFRPPVGQGPSEYIQMSRPGEYKVRPGDVIEIDYRFAQANPNPAEVAKKVSAQVTKGGAVTESDAGVRVVDDGATAMGKLVFAFEAKAAGKDTVTVVIDGKKYEYKFEVLNGGKK